MHADRSNRLLLALAGLLVLAAGGAGMAASTGVFGADFARRTLLDNPAGRYIGHHGGWLWPAVAGACLLLALACLRWIVALLASTDRAGDITIPGDTGEGTTILQPAAITDALTREISAYHGVETAKGRVIGDGRNPEIVLWGIHLTGAESGAAAGVHPFSMAGSPPGGPGSVDDPSPGRPGQGAVSWRRAGPGSGPGGARRPAPAPGRRPCRGWPSGAG